MFEDNFMVLVDVLFYRQETKQHRDDGIADELHGQVANDERRFHALGLGGELRIIPVCGEKRVQNSVSEPRKADHDGAVYRHGETVAPETVFRLQMVEDVGQEGERDVHGGYGADTFQNHPRADDIQIMYVDKADETAQNGNDEPADDRVLFYPALPQSAMPLPFRLPWGFRRPVPRETWGRAAFRPN